MKNKYHHQFYIEEEVGQDFIDLESEGEEIGEENNIIEQDESNINDEAEEIKLRINAKTATLNQR